MTAARIPYATMAVRKLKTHEEIAAVKAILATCINNAEGFFADDALNEIRNALMVRDLNRDRVANGCRPLVATDLVPSYKRIDGEGLCGFVCRSERTAEFVTAWQSAFGGRPFGKTREIGDSWYGSVQAD